MFASLFMIDPLFFNETFWIGVKTHYVIRPIKLHKLHFIYVHDVFNQGSEIEV